MSKPLEQRRRNIADLIALVTETKRKVSMAAHDLEELTQELRRRLDEDGEDLIDDDEVDDAHQ